MHSYAQQVTFTVGAVFESEVFCKSLDTTGEVLLCWGVSMWLGLDKVEGGAVEFCAREKLGRQKFKRENGFRHMMNTPVRR